MNKIILGVGCLAALVGGFLIGGYFNTPTQSIGGLIHNIQEDFSAGISVNGTEIINSAGQIIGVINGSTGTYSSTLNVTGATTLGSTDVSRFTQGGSRLATSSTAIATGVLTQAQLISNIGIDMTLTGEATHTMTLPATSTLTSFIPNAGDYAVLNYRVLGTAATASSTIAAGTGMDLVVGEATGADVIIEAGNESWLKFIRQTDGDVTVFVDEYIAAD